MACNPEDALFRVPEDGDDRGAPSETRGVPDSEIVPEAAGSFLYYWTAETSQGAGRIMRVNLQGSPRSEVFWPTASGRDPACAGCHSLSPDGRFVALTEVRSGESRLTFRILETTTGETATPPGLDDALFAAWNPRTETDPPAQFLYVRDDRIYKASVARGIIGPLEGASDGAFIQTSPAWGPNGKIAFVRQPRGGTCAAPQGVRPPSGGPVLCGPTDVIEVPEEGGAPTPVSGAARNGKANYHPAYSPNGRWIAFTQSASALTTYVAADAQIRLAAADGSGRSSMLELLQSPGSASSWPTWSLDGRFLSFSSNRPGGKGGFDIYLAPIDPEKGEDGPAESLTVANSPGFDHIGRWAP